MWISSLDERSGGSLGLISSGRTAAHHHGAVAGTGGHAAHASRRTLMGDLDDLRWGLEQVKAGKIKPTLDKVYSLHEASEAHARLAAGNALGTIVLKP